MDSFRFQYVTWSPDGTMIVSVPLLSHTHSVTCPTFWPHPQAYVLNYNIYLLNLTQPGADPVPVTTGGSEDGTWYGVPDWVYEGTYVIKLAKVLVPDEIGNASFSSSLIQRRSFLVTMPSGGHLTA